MEHIYTARGIPMGSQTQVGFVGSLAQVLQQRMSDLEGRALALRWAVPIHPVPNMAPMRQPQWPLYEQRFHRIGAYALELGRQANIGSGLRPQGKVLPDRASLDETPNV